MTFCAEGAEKIFLRALLFLVQEDMGDTWESRAELAGMGDTWESRAELAGMGDTWTLL